MFTSREAKVHRAEHAHGDVSVAHEDRCLLADGVALHLRNVQHISVLRDEDSVNNEDDIAQGWSRERRKMSSFRYLL